jgi:hypothetical protein
LHKKNTWVKLATASDAVCVSRSDNSCWHIGPGSDATATPFNACLVHSHSPQCEGFKHLKLLVSNPLQLSQAQKAAPKKKQKQQKNTEIKKKIVFHATVINFQVFGAFKRRK